MSEFFKEYKEKSNNEILEVEDENGNGNKIISPDYISDIEKKFNVLNEEIKKRKG